MRAARRRNESTRQMLTRRGALMAAAVFVGPPSFARAEVADDAAPIYDPARPAIGAWIGRVSWSEAFYAWYIEADGVFTSGRLNRGQDGRGNLERRG